MNTYSQRRKILTEKYPSEIRQILLSLKDSNGKSLFSYDDTITAGPEWSIENILQVEMMNGIIVPDCIAEPSQEEDPVSVLKDLRKHINAAIDEAITKLTPRDEIVSKSPPKEFPGIKP